jgi:hypothetical protein
METANRKMSILIEYTEEDLLTLNSMVDARNNNVNNFEPNQLNAIDPQGVWRLFRPAEIMGVPLAFTLDKFIRFLSPSWKDGTMRYLIYRESLENVPLYINKHNNLGLIAQWRLRIGK